MFKRKIFNVLICFIIIIAIILIIIGLVKIINVNKDLKSGIKEAEEVFSSSDSNDENVDLETKIENEQKLDTSKAIGIITFKLQKEYKTAIYENITEDILRKGAGRATGTGKLNEKGNCVLYGHRDSAFRALWDIKVGDLAEVKTKATVKQYKVYNIYITDKNDKNICNQNLDEKYCKLTLVTCYPFVYSGPANQRCVVEMRELE